MALSSLLNYSDWMSNISLFQSVRRGEAAALGRQVAGGATELNKKLVKYVVQFRLPEYPKELGHIHKSPYWNVSNKGYELPRIVGLILISKCLKGHSKA